MAKENHLSIVAPTYSLFIIHRSDCNEEVFELFIRCSVSSAFAVLYSFVGSFACFSWLPFVFLKTINSWFFSPSIYEGNGREANNIRYILCGCAMLSWFVFEELEDTAIVYIFVQWFWLQSTANYSIELICCWFYRFKDCEDWSDNTINAIYFTTQHRILIQCKLSPCFKQSILNCKFILNENIQINSVPFSIKNWNIFRKFDLLKCHTKYLSCQLTWIKTCHLNMTFVRFDVDILSNRL